jgi:hypothetical protein
MTSMNSFVRLSILIAAAVLTIAPSLNAQPAVPAASPQGYVGFDRNNYPGDSALPALRKNFSFAGYWLTNPPGEHRNGWVGKREILLQQGFGFLVLANGRFDKQIKTSGRKPEALGQQDAAAAVAAAIRERFPPHTILFLDQEEGGRLLPEQMAYLLAWTEAVANSGYRPGVYTSGQPVEDGPGVTITTAQDIREHVAARHLHEIAMWVYQDACPPAPGCTVQPPRLSGSGTPGAMVWQYAQSPRRRESTAACAKTYAADGNCYVGEPKGLLLDLNVSASPDPSQGR